MGEKEPKLAKLEMVSYRTPDLEHASYYFIKRFGQYSQAYGINTALTYFNEIRKIINSKNPKTYKLSTPGIDIYFCGFISPIPKMENGKLIFEAAEPGFAILPNNRSLETISGPARKSQLRQITDSVMRDMGKNYRVDIHRDPDMITFPKQIYGKVEVFNAALLA